MGLHYTHFSSTLLYIVILGSLLYFMTLLNVTVYTNGLCCATQSSQLSAQLVSKPQHFLSLKITFISLTNVICISVGHWKEVSPSAKQWPAVSSPILG